MQSFIIVPAGHGLGFLALIEFATLFLRNSVIKFSFNEYEDSFGVVSILSFVGQMILLVSFFIKRQVVFARILLTGLFILFLGFFFLTIQSIKGETLALISFITGIPFIISTTLLVSKLMKQPLEKDDSE